VIAAIRARIVTGLALGSRFCTQTLGHSPQPVIWLLGHMRAGTSLLIHLLLTNPQIASLGERNQRYATELDCDRLVSDVRLTNKSFWRPYRYVVDQINHSRFTPNETLLNHPRVRIIFLVREPEASIASIVELTRSFYQEWPVERAADYYNERLDTLARFGESIENRSQACFLTYPQITEQTDATFQGLQRFLTLDTGFTERYPLHPFTGKRGDPSQNLRAGRILRERHGVSIPMPSHLLAEAQAKYHHCVATLSRWQLTNVPLAGVPSKTP
jgi:hypothetical protein